MKNLLTKRVILLLTFVTGFALTGHTQNLDKDKIASEYINLKNRMDVLIPNATSGEFDDFRLNWTLPQDAENPFQRQVQEQQMISTEKLDEFRNRVSSEVLTSFGAQFIKGVSRSNTPGKNSFILFYNPGISKSTVTFETGEELLFPDPKFPGMVRPALEGFRIILERITRSDIQYSVINLNRDSEFAGIVTPVVLQLPPTLTGK